MPEFTNSGHPKSDGLEKGADSFKNGNVGYLFFRFLGCLFCKKMSDCCGKTVTPNGKTPCCLLYIFFFFIKMRGSNITRPKGSLR